jgi:multiple sugar transport system ATP-binding protein
MGSPSMNLIPATVVEATGGLAVSIERAEGARILLPLADGAAHAPARRYLRRPVLLGLRPESITDPGAAEVRTAHHHRIECLVEVTEPTGPDTLAVIRLGGIEATARLKADADVAPDAPGTFVVDMAKAVLFDPATESRI